jgi:hypothetical protein
MNNKRMRVKGLANIAMLVARTDLPTAPPKNPAATRRTRDEIFQRTREKCKAAIPLGANLDPKHWALIDTYLKASLDASYNLGYAEALETNGQVERLLEKQYDARTKVTMPAVAAGIMEQLGLPSMTLDLGHLATVFTRNRIDYTLSDENVIDYRLLPLDVVAQA